MNPAKTLLLTAGLLAVVLPAGSADPLDGSIDAECRFRIDSGADPNTVVLSLTGEAVAPLAGPDSTVVMLTAVKCELLDSDGDLVMEASGSVNGPAAAAAKADAVPNPGPLTVCTSAQALYGPTPVVIVRLERTCVTP
jgi:hypothetical protein